MLDLFNDSDASNSAEHIFRVEKKLKNIFKNYSKINDLIHGIQIHFQTV